MESETHAAADSVVLDIGGGVGALVIHGGAQLDGQEIEVSPTQGGRRVHAVFHKRQVSDVVTFAAVFPSLISGSFHVWGTGDHPLLEVTISDGRVTEVDLSARLVQAEGGAGAKTT